MASLQWLLQVLEEHLFTVVVSVLCLGLWKVLRGPNSLIPFTTKAPPQPTKGVFHPPFASRGLVRLIFGHSFEMGDPNQEPMHALDKWARQARGAPVVVTVPITGNSVVITHPSDVYHMFVTNHNNYVKGQVFEVVSTFLGRGLFTTTHEETHTAHKRIIAPLLAKHHVDKHYARIIAEHANHLLQRVEAARVAGGHLPLATLLDDFSMDSILHILLDNDEDREQVRRHFVKMTGLHPAETVVPQIPPWVGSLVALVILTVPGVAVMRPGHLIGRSQLTRLFAKFVSSNSRMEDDDGNVRSMAAVMSGGGRLTAQQVRDHVILLLFAGHDTSSKAMLWTLYLLALHSDEQTKLADAIRDAGLHAPVTAAFTSAVVGVQVPQLRAVVNEALRVYPPAPITARKALRDDVLPATGAEIPAGTEVILSPFITQRLPDIWGDDADNFRPSRWLNSDGCGVGGATSEAGCVMSKYPSAAFMPFTFGKHGCIGLHLAMLEIEVCIALLVSHYRVSLKPGLPLPKRCLASTMTIQPDGPIPFEFTPR